ncbi:hypothetical protein [Saccharothrix coeruleofusca]|uniref:Uncharacterized protein n=1 Tax=Saccharothrix coeruleofusca TaxID=33919 RepID=A0A918AN86_9PSEU|nr:hypothetical protein [Saccharothrix coeruleofusca]MBP2341021.1 hypothetical protein [Saccharothrix coeruleofusca]GGP61533.1 hypothetical protein GCM10010185_37630 [Saccharothrix coeruleofusca]
MPIRTNRGRAAVYRRLWGWPLRSPNHLVATIVGFAALVATLSVVLPNTVGSKSATPPAGGSTPAAPPPSGNQIGVLPSVTSSPLPTKAPSPTTPPPSSAVQLPGDVQLTAENWVDAWVDHPPGTSNEQWLKGLEPWTSKELLPTLQSVDPANVPNEIKGPITRTGATTDSADFEAALETGKLVLTVVKLPEGWRVHKYSRVG